MLNEQVRKIMTKKPIFVKPGDTVQEVSDMMLKKRLQQLPVVKDDKLVGLITSYDLWRNLKDGSVSKKQKVKEVMTTNVLTIAPKDKVGTAAELFMDKRFKTLPVVNLKNELKGVITAFDVIKHIMQREYDHPILYKNVLSRE